MGENSKDHQSNLLLKATFKSRFWATCSEPCLSRFILFSEIEISQTLLILILILLLGLILHYGEQHFVTEESCPFFLTLEKSLVLPLLLLSFRWWDETIALLVLFLRLWKLIFKLRFVCYMLQLPVVFKVFLLIVCWICIQFWTEGDNIACVVSKVPDKEE